MYKFWINDLATADTLNPEANRGFTTMKVYVLLHFYFSQVYSKVCGISIDFNHINRLEFNCCFYGFLPALILIESGN